MSPILKNTNGDERKVDKFLDENCAITTKQLRERFMNANLDDDMKVVKLVIVYFVELILLRKENRNYINEINLLLVDNFNKFNEYPWGRSCFNMIIESLRKCIVDYVAKHKKKSNIDCKSKGTTYSVHEFPCGFLVTKLN